MKIRPIRSAFLAYVLTFIAAGRPAFAVEPPAEPPEGKLALLGRAGEFSPVSFPFDGWQVSSYSESGFAAMAAGKPVRVGVANVADDATVETEARKLAEALAPLFGMEGVNLRFEGISRSTKTTTAIFKPLLENRPVYGSFLRLTFNRAGELISVKGEGFGRDASGGFKLSASDAESAALGALSGLKPAIESSRSGWLPFSNSASISLAPVWILEISTADPELRPVLFIDAASGDLVAAENRVAYERLPGSTEGDVHPFYRHQQEERRSFGNAWTRLVGGATVFSSPDGAFSFEVNPGAAPFRVESELRGRWVDVNFDDGADASQTVRVDRVQNVSVVWNNDNSREDERMLYYHTNAIHSFWKSLDQGLDGLDFPLPAIAAFGDNYDNAFWNGQGIYFGEGNEMDNFALYTDIIQHEYGHAITSQIYTWEQLPYREESGALNEAWSDYFPCSISNEPYMGEGGLVRMGGYIRHIDNDLVYPDDWFGEVHYDSRMVSAAMWHTREVLGRDVTDPLFHFARYQLGNEFLAYFTDVLAEDDDDGDITNGTPNARVLYEQFGRHGIGPGLRPKMAFALKQIRDDNARGAAGDGDYHWEPGETVRLEATLVRKGSLFPPPAENVRVTLTTNSRYLQLVDDVAAFGAMGVGDSVRNDAPFLIRVAGGAPLHFAFLYLTVTAEGEENILVDSIRIPIGKTETLLVNDGEDGFDRTDWFRQALDFNGVVYAEHRTFGERLDLAWRLPQFRSVIWFTGDDREGILNESSRAQLAEFIGRGGNVFLSGQGIPIIPGIEAFLEDFFGARPIPDTLDQFWLEGEPGDPVGQGMDILLLGAGGAMNQRNLSTLEAVNGVEVFKFSRMRTRPTGGVRYVHPEAGGKTILFSFGFEGISGHGGTNTRFDVMEAVMRWFGEPVGVSGSQSAAPLEFAVGEAYPNPFNPTTVIPVELSRPGSVRAVIFDLAGREVSRETFELNGGAGSIRLSGEGWESGLYLVKIESEGRIATRKLLLVR